MIFKYLLKGGYHPNLTGQPILELSRSPGTVISITKPLLNFVHRNHLFAQIVDDNDDDDYCGDHSDHSTWPNEQSWSLVTHYWRRCCCYIHCAAHQIPVILSIPVICSICDLIPVICPTPIALITIRALPSKPPLQQAWLLQVSYKYKIIQYQSAKIWI